MMKPPVGTTMYCVKEHLYYEGGRTGPKMEHVVFCGEVVEHFGGSRQEFRLCGKKGLDGCIKLAFHTLQDIGKSVFFTAREAAELAERMTKDYERRWAWTARWGDIPLRRPWEHLLQEEGPDTRRKDEKTTRDGRGRSCRRKKPAGREEAMEQYSLFD